jgi:hypothetical protein
MHQDPESFFSKYLDESTTTKITQELHHELHAESHNSSKQNEPSYVMESEPLLTDFLPAEEHKAQEVFERSPPIPNTANTKVRSVLLPQLYELFELLMIPFSGIELLR